MWGKILGRSNKLSAERWIEIGLTDLAASGYAGLKADSLSRSQNVTRGSFYYHFESVTDFHRALVARWQDLAQTAILGEIDPTHPAADRLHRLLQICLTRDARLERQVRIWAAASALPREAMQKVDTLRLDYIFALLRELGLPEDLADVRARLIYGCCLGMSLRGGLKDRLLDDAVEELARFALFPMKEPGRGTASARR